MKNMGFSELVLVVDPPRHFPHDEATGPRVRGRGRFAVGARRRYARTTRSRDCHFAVGASARARAIEWQTLEPRACAARLAEESAAGPVAVVMGPEKSGLSNADLDRCQVLLTIPTDPDFSSLNLAMAVQVITYELRLATLERTPPEPPEIPPATSEEMELLSTGTSNRF